MHTHNVIILPSPSSLRVPQSLSEHEQHLRRGGGEGKSLKERFRETWITSERFLVNNVPVNGLFASVAAASDWNFSITFGDSLET